MFKLIKSSSGSQTTLKKKHHKEDNAQFNYFSFIKSEMHKTN